MEDKAIQSAGGIVYYMENGKPKFLVLKRKTKSNLIERVPPKGKIAENEPVQETVVREVSEETGIPLNEINLRTFVGNLAIRKKNLETGSSFSKDVKYYLVEFFGDPNDVSVKPVEGYIGVYKRATIEEIYRLVVYRNLREIFARAYNLIFSLKKKSELIDKLVSNDEKEEEEQDLTINFDSNDSEIKGKKIVKRA